MTKASEGRKVRRAADRSPAAAVEAQPVPREPVRPEAPDQDIPLILKSSEIVMIGEALAAGPYKMVAPLLAKLQKQFDEGVKAAQANAG